MTDWPVYGKIAGPIVMIGFGSIGRGTLPLIERHFDFDKTRFVVIDPDDKDRKILDERGIPFIQQARDARELPRTADAAADRGRRPGLLRQSLGRHLFARHHGAVPRARRALHRHRHRALARLLFRSKLGHGRAHQLRAARDDAAPPSASARPARPRFPAAAPIPAWCRGSSSRRCSTSRPILNTQVRGAEDPRGLGASSRKKLGVKGIHIAERDTQRAKTSEADRHFRQHLVGRRLRLGRPAAGRTRLGHARKVDADRTAASTRPAARPRSI